MSMKDAARRCAIWLMDAGSEKKKWTPAEKRDWGTAFNALHRLAGKKTRWRRGKMTSK